ncbi:MAG: hypothetical protein K0S37_1200 [Microbacterium sp.]|jgi:TetR/AcrR family transcriptional repressor of mexJK operon|nr:hypothetical protein [Microbacterium sp.]
MTDTSHKPVRQGQAAKRAAILTAARELFVQAGVERTSMDAVAARAAVSKRTVYDYYGDKRRLLLGVVEDAGEAALRMHRQLVDQYLSDRAAFEDVTELERALVALAADLGTSQLVDASYAAAVKLIAENEILLPELEDHPLDEAHSQVLAERFAHLANIGVLDIQDSRLAADHFHALTTLRVLNEPLGRRADPERVRRIMTDGAHAFVRAYGGDRRR